MDGMLSQDEINALLSGMNTGDGPSDNSSDDSSDNNSDKFTLADSEKDAVGEISNISMGTAATTLSSLLNQKVNITTPRVEITTWDNLATHYDRPCVMLQISYKEGLDGNNVLVLKEKDVKIITDLMMGGSGAVDDNEQLSELHLSAIGEAMNQMMGSAATSMSSMFNRKIDISPPVANLIETYNDSNGDMPAFLSEQFVLVAFTMQIGELIDSEIMQLYPIDFAKELLEMFTTTTGDMNATANAENTNDAKPAQETATQAQPQAPQQDMGAMNGMPAQQPMNGQQMGMPQMGMPQMGMQQMGMPQMGYGQQMGMPQMGYAQQMQPQQNINVQPASFQPFSNDVNAMMQKENINLIKDVPLEVTVELGRTTKSIKDILEFAPGTIVELNKIAGEAIDVLVNGKFVAKGEVVVIEESFGVRITEIIKDNI